MIRKLSDLKGMTEQDILRLSLPVGEAIRLRLSIERLGPTGEARHNSYQNEFIPNPIGIP